jgi:glycosyltransferase involved in cell wall biosynthesis
LSEDQSERPFFSVVVPTYNRPDLVQRSVTSVLRQSFPSFELIIADDGSALDYSGVLTSFLVDERVRYVKAEENKGAGAARNLGISVARGKYVAFLDDDDEFLESFLEESYSILHSGSEPGHVSFSSVQWVEDVAADRSQPTRTQKFETDSPDDVSLFETFLSIGTGYGLCVSMDCLRAVGVFDESLLTTEDTELFLRIVRGGYKPRVTPGVHVSIHEHSGKRLTGAQGFLNNIAEIRYLLTAYEDLFCLYPTLKAQLIAHMNFLSSQVEEFSE